MIYMINLPDDNISYWMRSSLMTDYPALSEDIEVDAAIAGGGIAGMTAAYLLKESGLRVAVLEKNTIGSGTTSKTTGKVTAQHGLIYADLQKRLGAKTAKDYADANLTALEEIKQLIRSKNVDCGFEIDDNYVFTTDPNKVDEFKEEAKIAAGLGLPASFETATNLPFVTQAAVKFTDQAKFNALRYVQALAGLVHGDGSFVFEHSNVNGFDDGVPASISTGTAKVSASDIIVTTKVPAMPLMARGGYAVLEYPHTSYIVAGKLPGKLKGMYISPDEGHYSILPVAHGTGQLLLIGGENHIPGLGSVSKRHQKLANYAEEYFGVKQIDYAWQGMDYMAYDGPPLIGKLYPWSKHMYVATGFRKWGLTTSMVAGMLLRDVITGRKNPWAETFDSTRPGPVRSIPSVLKQALKR